jgi:hypothetical protein
MEKVTSLEEKQSAKKCGIIIGKIFLEKREIMSQGVKVKINTTDENQNKITGDGYICKRINAELYEIWSEEHQSVMLLTPEEFIEEN